MDHVLKALDEHIAHQDWLLKCARREIDELRQEVERLRNAAGVKGEGAEGPARDDSGKCPA